MNWETLGLLILVFIGYTHLLSTARKKSVSGLVKLHLESREKRDDGVIPEEIEVFSKSCPFIVTPVPGMEYLPADIEGAVIKRVIIDEQGLLEVICLLNISVEENEFQKTCEHLENQGWLKNG